jgi:hypothetical protein
MGTGTALPKWVIVICSTTTLLSILWSFTAIFFQVRNYRKPFEQRLIVRILLLVPLFAISCYSMLMNYPIGKLVEPIREIYEAFVIYTFYKLLVLMLGGERRIILMTVNKEPVSHPFPMSLLIRRVNISHPQHFLAIKRSILQYVWIKPLILLAISVSGVLGLYHPSDLSFSSVSLWLGIIYNMSVSLSLYTLAMFWKCLYDELNVFDPWRKFMCVKLIIFASYWQGLIIGGLSLLGVFDENTPRNASSLAGHGENFNLGVQIQNGLLCFEMLFFAWLHWNSFPYTDFTAEVLPDAARMRTRAAMNDWMSIGDLLYDLKITTMYGDSYNLKNFDSLTDSKIYDKSDTFNQKIYQGLRVSADGKKYWININDEDETRNGQGEREISSLPISGGSDIVSDANTGRGGNVSRYKGSDASIQTQNIENQVRVLLGSSPLVGSVGKDIPTDRTPLLRANESKRKYLSHIDDLFNDSNLSECDESINQNGQRSDQWERIPSEISLNEELIKDEKAYEYVRRHYIPDEAINYPVEYEPGLTDYSTRINRLRRSMQTPDQDGPSHREQWYLQPDI